MSVSRIRFYEVRGLLPATPREGNGYRSYGQEAVVILQFVDRAQRLGFSLVDIKSSMSNLDAPLPSPVLIVAALRQKQQDINDLIAAATIKKDAIAALLDELQCVA